MGNSPSKKKKSKTTSRTDDNTNAPSNTTNSTPSAPNPAPSHIERKNSHISQSSSSPAIATRVDSQPIIKSPSKSHSVKSEPDKNSFSLKKLEDLFDKYKEAENPQIGPEGIEALCRDLNVEPENIVVLVLAWHLNATSMGYFKKEEFVGGLSTLSVDSIDKLKSHLITFKNELDDPSKYKDIYRYAFGFAKEKEQKILDLATADGMLDLLMGGRFPHTEKLREFLREQTSYKSVNLDQWMNILEFSRTIKADLSNYDENGAWPVLLDEYCEWAKDK